MVHLLVKGFKGIPSIYNGKVSYYLNPFKGRSFSFHLFNTSFLFKFHCGKKFGVVNRDFMPCLFIINFAEFIRYNEKRLKTAAFWPYKNVTNCVTMRHDKVLNKHNDKGRFVNNHLFKNKCHAGKIRKGKCADIKN